MSNKISDACVSPNQQVPQGAGHVLAATPAVIEVVLTRLVERIAELESTLEEAAVALKAGRDFLRKEKGKDQQLADLTAERDQWKERAGKLKRYLRTARNSLDLHSDDAAVKSIEAVVPDLDSDDEALAPQAPAEGKSATCKNGTTSLCNDCRHQKGCDGLCDPRLACTDYQPIEKCEGCQGPAVTHDNEGVPLCQQCADQLRAESQPPAAEKEGDKTE